MPAAISRGQPLRGVRPLTDGGTNAANAVGARTNLGVVLYDTTTIGAAYPALGLSIILDATATRADVQTALNTSNVETVYLRRGNYTWDNTTLTIPQGKSLIGLGSLTDNTGISSASVVISYSGSSSNDFVDCAGSNRLANIHFNFQSHTATVGNVHAIQGANSSGGHCYVDNCYVTGYADNITTGAPNYAFYFVRATVTNCVAYDCSAGFLYQGHSNDLELQTLIDSCNASSCTFTTSGGGGFRGLGGRYQVRNCRSNDNACDGFKEESGGGPWMYYNCYAFNNTLHGFRMIVTASSTIPCLITGSQAFNNDTGGMSMTSSGANASAIHSNAVGGNLVFGYETTNVDAYNNGVVS